MNISALNNLNIPQDDLSSVLSEESITILQKLKKINDSYFFRPDKTLVNKLKVIEPVELTKVLKCFFAEMIQKDLISNPIKFLDRIATVIPLKKIQEATEDGTTNALQEAKSMLEEAKLYFQMSQGTSPSIRTRISSILEGIISVIESIITAFGVGDFFKPAESDIHADFKSQKIMMLLSIFSMIATIILPILGATTGGLILGGTLLCIAVLSIIWPLIKPMTTHLPANAENWTKQIQNGSSTAEGRKESLNEIADIIKMNRHAILVGPSRVGKSLTAKAFAKAIERGDYPELKGKTVFCINTADIVDQKASFLGGGNDILKKISAAMGRHRNDIILVFDEIHMACKNNEKIADQFKTFLDEGGDFPHVIGITTDVEYEKYVKDNNAFSLRFEKVDIENTKQHETLKILSNTILRSRAQPIVEEDVLTYIYDISCKNNSSDFEDAPQPTTALKLLKRCINRTEKTQKSPTEKKIIKVSNEILSLRSQAVANRSKKKDGRIQIADLEKQISELSEALNQERKELDKLFKSKKLLDLVTKETYSSVLKISNFGQKKLKTKDTKQLNLFLLLQGFLGPSLETYIKNKAGVLGVNAVIDEALVNEVANV